MQIIQPHYHAIARTAQDYERMAMSGVVAVCEPAFWAGYDRRYRKPSLIISLKFQSSSRLGLRNSVFVTSVGLRSIPKKRKTKNSLTRSFASCRNFSTSPIAQCRGDRTAQVHPERNRILAGSRRHGDEDGQLVLIHTPHLADKAHGTKTVLEVLAGMDVDPNRIWIDHVEEQTIESVLDAGIGRE